MKNDLKLYKVDTNDFLPSIKIEVIQVCKMTDESFWRVESCGSVSKARRFTKDHKMYQDFNNACHALLSFHESRLEAAKKYKNECSSMLGSVKKYIREQNESSDSD